MPPIIYTHVTFAQAKQQLANRLFDSAAVFWSDAELGLLIMESLSTWQALTSYWRAEFLFASQANQTWYDMSDPSVMPQTLRPLTVRDTDLYSSMQYHLLEPQGINPWTGSAAPHHRGRRRAHRAPRHGDRHPPHGLSARTRWL
jgi:hypothetical protein